MRDRLQAGLIEAMKTRDRVAVTALRSALAAIANAESVTDAPAPMPGDYRVAGGVQGLGRGDVARRTLSELDVLDIVDREVEDWTETARQYDALGQTSAASQLRAQTEVLTSYLRS
jgi:uncharacterized protein YqeY